MDNFLQLLNEGRQEVTNDAEVEGIPSSERQIRSYWFELTDADDDDDKKRTVLSKKDRSNLEIEESVDALRLSCSIGSWTEAEKKFNQVLIAAEKYFEKFGSMPYSYLEFLVSDYKDELEGKEKKDFERPTDLTSLRNLVAAMERESERLKREIEALDNDDDDDDEREQVVGSGVAQADEVHDEIFFTTAIKKFLEDRKRKVDTYKMIADECGELGFTAAQVSATGCVIEIQLEVDSGKEYVPLSRWCNALESFKRMLEMIRQKSLVVSDSFFDAPIKGSRCVVLGGLHSFLKKFWKQLVNYAQIIPMNDTAYFDVPYVENQLLELAESVVDFYTLRSQLRAAAECAALILEIIGYRRPAAHSLLFAKMSEKPKIVSEDLVTSIRNIIKIQFPCATRIIKMKTTCFLAYQLAMSGAYREGRDTLLRAGVRNVFEGDNVDTEVLMALGTVYNRAVAQLGLSAFIAGDMYETYQLLGSIWSHEQPEVLLGQKIPGNMDDAKTLTFRDNMVSPHLHIPYQQLELAAMLSALIIDTTKEAKNPYDRNQRDHQRYFYQAITRKIPLMGRPSSTQERIGTAYKALKQGDFNAARNIVEGMGAWEYLPDGKKALALYIEKLKETSLRIFCLTNRCNFSSFSVSMLSLKYDLSVTAVKDVINQIISENDSLIAYWDRDEEFLFVDRSNTTRVQHLVIGTTNTVSALAPVEDAVAEAEEEWMCGINNLSSEEEFLASLRVTKLYFFFLFLFELIYLFIVFLVNLITYVVFPALILETNKKYRKANNMPSEQPTSSIAQDTTEATLTHSELNLDELLGLLRDIDDEISQLKYDRDEAQNEQRRIKSELGKESLRGDAEESELKEHHMNTMSRDDYCRQIKVLERKKNEIAESIDQLQGEVNNERRRNMGGPSGESEALRELLDSLEATLQRKICNPSDSPLRALQLLERLYQLTHERERAMRSVAVRERLRSRITALKRKKTESLQKSQCGPHTPGKSYLEVRDQYLREANALREANDQLSHLVKNTKLSRDGACDRSAALPRDVALSFSENPDNACQDLRNRIAAAAEKKERLVKKLENINSSGGKATLDILTEASDWALRVLLAVMNEFEMLCHDLRSAHNRCQAMPFSLTPPYEYKSTIPKCVMRIDDSWFHGKDATDAFYSLHSKEAIRKLKRMKALPLKEDDAPRDKVSKDFDLLVKELETKGWFKRRWHIDFFRNILPALLLCAIGTSLSWTHPLLASLLIGLGMQQGGWLAHDYGHARGAASRWIGLFLGGLINAFSTSWWSHKHNAHHIYPNRKYSDADVHNEPVIFLWPPTEEEDTPFRRYQHFYYPLAYSLLYVSWRLQSLKFALGSRNFRELALMGVNYLWLLYLPLTVAIGSIIAGGFFVAIVVTSNHQTEEMLEPDADYNYIVDQYRTTRGVHCSDPFFEWFFGGMQYQLEHHLLPMVPRYRYPEARVILKKFSEDHDLPFHVNGYLLKRNNYRDSFQFFSFYCPGFRTRVCVLWNASNFSSVRVAERLASRFDVFFPPLRQRI
eukprot:gene6617-4737_t